MSPPAKCSLRDLPQRPAEDLHRPIGLLSQHSQWLLASGSAHPITDTRAQLSRPQLGD